MTDQGMEREFALEPLSADDLLRMPDDDRRHDLVGGWLVSEPPSNEEHAVISANIVGRLWNHVRANRLGVVSTNDPGFVLAHGLDGEDVVPGFRLLVSELFDY